MVRRMMQLAKMEATELQRSSEPVALTPILEDLVPPLADLALQKGLTFRKNIEPGLPLILGEPERLEEIIRNLVTNAIKFTPSGTVRLDVGQQDDRVIITVSDQGIGIPRQALPNLFKRFYRAQTAVERGIAGTGLGLYMVKQSVEHYNGTITVTSIENEGTTFIVSFPVYEL
jgi:signal transduction histidine kinase